MRVIPSSKDRLDADEEFALGLVCSQKKKEEKEKREEAQGQS